MSAGAILPGEARLPSPVTMGEASTPAASQADKAAMTGGKAPAGLNLPKAAFFSQNTGSAGELFKQLAVALKLPADGLSVTLLAFSRFFSLSPSQALIAALRRDVLASSNSSPQTAAEKAVLEAKAMAAAAALDKGVVLSPEALERYARFLAPPAFAEDGEAGGKNAFADSGGRKNPRDREDAPDEDELRAIAEEASKEDDLLDVLNAIPGKNGHYWVVVPFTINVRGTELNVFLRILKGGTFSAGENEHLIVDIAASKRHYRCFLKKSSSKLRADIQVYPEVPRRALTSLSRKAEHFLAGASALTGKLLDFEEIIVRNGDQMPSWTQDWCAECLPSVDKAV